MNLYLNLQFGDGLGSCSPLYTLLVECRQPIEEGTAETCQFTSWGCCAGQGETREIDSKLLTAGQTASLKAEQRALDDGVFASVVDPRTHSAFRR